MSNIHADFYKDIIGESYDLNNYRDHQIFEIVKKAEVFIYSGDATMLALLDSAKLKEDKDYPYRGESIVLIDIPARSYQYSPEIIDLLRKEYMMTKNQAKYYLDHHKKLQQYIAYRIKRAYHATKDSRGRTDKIL